MASGCSECMSWKGRGDRNWTSVPTPASRSRWRFAVTCPCMSMIIAVSSRDDRHQLALDEHLAGQAPQQGVAGGPVVLVGEGLEPLPVQVLPVGVVLEKHRHVRDVVEAGPGALQER